MIEIKNLVKNYGDLVAVNDLSFKVKKGELFAFLGVNGAGKSTTINIICGLLEKTSGEIYFNGNLAKPNDSFIKEKIGIVFQNSCLDTPLTVLDNLKHRASLYGIWGEDFKVKLEELTELFETKFYEKVNHISYYKKPPLLFELILTHSAHFCNLFFTFFA